MRAKIPFAALEPRNNPRIRGIYRDYDYVDKLSFKEKTWLNKFTDEYYNDNLDRENLKKNLHKTKRLKKDCDDRNNSRNRDVLNIAQVSGKTKSVADFSKILDEKQQDVKAVEDMLIKIIDEDSD